MGIQEKLTWKVNTISEISNYEAIKIYIEPDWPSD